MTEICTDWVANHARRRPDSIALGNAEDGVTRTWVELDARVAALAGLLRNGWGVRFGDRVALIAENDPRVLELQFACMRIGAILVPLNWRLSLSELMEQLTASAPSGIVHDGEWRTVVDEITIKVPVPHRIAWNSSGAANDGGANDGVMGDGAVDDYESALASTSVMVAGQYLDPDAVTHILYTSGTTGKPKGVLCTNRMLATQAQNLAHASGMAERGGHHLNIVPLFHAGGLNVFTNPMLYWGGRVTTTRRFEPKATLDLLTDPALGVTHLCGVLQMYEWLVRLDDFPAARFPALRTVLTGGWGPSAFEIYRAFRAHGIYVLLSYGASELGPIVTVLSPPDDVAAESGSSGMVLPHTRIRLTAPDGAEVAPGEVGELWVRGGGVTPGYWRTPRAETFDGAWFRTGDAARMDEAGHVYIAGRLKEMYRSGGENVYPAEVEAVLVGMPGIAELAVVGVPDEKWGEVGLLAVVPKLGAEITLAGVHAFAEGRLARFKLPAHVVMLDDMPRSATEKISRVAIREQFTTSPDT
ncbi:MAG TPA: AMP-binding protein [Pseudonocardia sp.]|nr:AMP-binding protein [Pseudonocardia sp.]